MRELRTANTKHEAPLFFLCLLGTKLCRATSTCERDVLGGFSLGTGWTKAHHSLAHVRWVGGRFDAVWCAQALRTRTQAILGGRTCLSINQNGWRWTHDGLMRFDDNDTTTTQSPSGAGRASVLKIEKQQQLFSYSAWRDLSFSDIRDRSSDYGSEDKYDDKFLSYRGF